MGQWLKNTMCAAFFFASVEYMAIKGDCIDNELSGTLVVVHAHGWHLCVLWS